MVKTKKEAMFNKIGSLNHKDLNAYYSGLMMPVHSERWRKFRANPNNFSESLTKKQVQCQIMKPQKAVKDVAYLEEADTVRHYFPVGSDNTGGGETISLLKDSKKNVQRAVINKMRESEAKAK